MKGRLVLSSLTIVALIALLQPTAAAAYRAYVERTAASGVPTHIWTFSNCIGRKQYPFAGTAFTEHGNVTFKEGVKSRCGIANVVTREVWYTSPVGFTGVDRVSFPRGHGRSEIFAILVH